MAEKNNIEADELQKLLEVVKVPLEDPAFLSRVYFFLSREMDKDLNKREDPLEKVIRKQEQVLSRFFDRSAIQESCIFRNNTKARELALLLIDEKGELKQKEVKRASEIMETHLYSLGPGRYHDISRDRHILSVLTLLRESEGYGKLLKRISRPYSHKNAEKIIRDTLHLSSTLRLTDAHARQATLAAWLTYLRQNVGSCFATAPAIMVQGEQPEKFLHDIAQLLAKGCLIRTFGGVEYSVPLSPSWGVGDLKKPFLLSRTSQVGKSLGFITAFQSAGLLESDDSRRNKIKRTQKLIFEAFNLFDEAVPPQVITPDEVIRKVLMRFNELSEIDLKEFKKRPKMIAFTANALATMGKKKSKQPLIKGAKTFQDQYTVAKRSFKMLTDNALLKSWEFSVASFAETKAEFSKWNLYSSLGMAPDDEGGIGSCLYEEIKVQLERCNDLVQEMNEKYEQFFAQVKYIEGRMKRASESEVRWLKNDYRVNVSEMNFFLEQRDQAHERAKRWANMFDFLIDQYIGKFREYFQEIYDADMHDVTTDPYDDSPAGFRLVYKHGRSNTSMWTLVRGKEQYIDFLAEFFTRTESEISSHDYLRGAEREFSQVVTKMISHIRSREFLESAFYRMAAAHGGKVVKNPLENLDKIDKKPWVYTSGGTMSHLVSCYFLREELPTTESRWVERPEELFAYFLDTMKALPTQVSSQYVEEPNKSMLMHSPTHAFILKPGKEPFLGGWRDTGYSYTWIRDNFFIPSRNFLHLIDLEPPMMDALVDELSAGLMEPYRHNFRKALKGLGGTKKIKEFRHEVIHAQIFHSGLQIRGELVIRPDEIDALLYSSLPLHLGHEAVEKIEALIENLPSPNYDCYKERMLSLLHDLSHSFNRYKILSAKRIRDIVKSLLLLVTASPTCHLNAHVDILETAQRIKLTLPSSMIFADTNWTKDYFAFVVNPGTEKLELWKVDEAGTEGMPMVSWEKWVDGSHKKPAWGIYTTPFEYGG